MIEADKPEVLYDTKLDGVHERFHILFRKSIENMVLPPVAFIITFTE